MGSKKLPQVALLWSQYAAYHVDRCAAVSRRLAGKAEVIAVEVAATSQTYAWEVAPETSCCEKHVLLPDTDFELIPRPQRLMAMIRAVRRCRMVFVGIGYNEPDVIIAAWVLRLLGVRVVMMTDSKFDDKQRSAGFELFKRMLLSAFNAAIVGGGARHMAYVRYLGFRCRTVLPGYDTVGLERIRTEARQPLAPLGTAYADRHFIYVGRFVEKKNLINLIEGYALYAAQAGPAARKLRMIGSGPLEQDMRGQIARLGLDEKIEILGFRPSQDVSRLLAESLALVLISKVEQWGLVINEALAVGLPVIVSHQVGSRDVLVRNLVNGFTIAHNDGAALCAAMLELGGDEPAWQAMVAGSHARAWLGDTERFADAAEVLFDPSAEAAASRTRAYLAELS
jgi:glycosyltransferase involved in cell wall biosynthesis